MKLQSSKEKKANIYVLKGHGKQNHTIVDMLLLGNIAGKIKI